MTNKSKLSDSEIDDLFSNEQNLATELLKRTEEDPQFAAKMKQILEEYDAYKKYGSSEYKKRQNALRKATRKEAHAQKELQTQTQIETQSGNKAQKETAVGKKGNRNALARINKFYKYAAILSLPLITLCAGIYYYATSDSRKPIPPGKEKAVFAMSNGDVVSVNSSVAKIRKTNGKEVIVPKVEIFNYIAQNKDFETANYSTIVVPPGGFFTVHLSDGSTITLNSKSKMHFPLKFTGNERKIWLEGEAYCEVEKDSIPFIVSTHTEEVTVMGTTFNITAYPEDNFATTALLTGKVKVTVKNNAKDSTLTLEPGECATFYKNGNRFEKFSDDVQLYTLWKEGIFKFRDTRLEDIVKVLKRWYRFDVEYEDDSMKDIRFNVLALKDNYLDEVFDLLQQTTTFKYSRNGSHFKIYR